MSNQRLLAMDGNFCFPSPDQIRDDAVRSKTRAIEDRILAAMRINKNWIRVDMSKLPDEYLPFLGELEAKSYRVGISDDRSHVIIEW